MTTKTRTRTTKSTEDAIVEKEASAAELRQQIANADQAISGLDLRIQDAETLMETAHLSVGDITDAQVTRVLRIRKLQEEDGRLSLELADLAVDVAIAETSATTRGIKKRSERRLDIATEIRQATTEDTKLRKAEAAELTQIESGSQVVEAERNQLLTQRAVFEGKRTAIFERLGQAIYREGAVHLAELAHARRGASLDARHFEEEEGRARQELKISLQPWYSLRQKAIQEFQLDRKPADGTTRIIMELIAMLDVIEANGPDTPMLLDGKLLSTQLSPLDANTLRNLLGMNTLSDMDRRNFFIQRREQLSNLLESHNRNRR